MISIDHNAMYILSNLYRNLTAIFLFVIKTHNHMEKIFINLIEFVIKKIKVQSHRPEVGYYSFVLVIRAE